MLKINLFMSMTMFMGMARKQVVGLDRDFLDIHMEGDLEEGLLLVRLQGDFVEGLI